MSVMFTIIITLFVVSPIAVVAIQRPHWCYDYVHNLRYNNHPYLFLGDYWTLHHSSSHRCAPLNLRRRNCSGDYWSHIRGPPYLLMLELTARQKIARLETHKSRLEPLGGLFSLA